MRWVSISSNVSSRRRRWSGRAMRSRSPRGSSTPTSRLTSRLHGPLLIAVGVILIAIAGFYVIEAFVAPNPLLRIVLRSVPVLRVAIWTLCYDKPPPFQRAQPMSRVAGLILLLAPVLPFALLLRGVVLKA